MICEKSNFVLFKGIMAAGRVCTSRISLQSLKTLSAPTGHASGFTQYTAQKGKGNRECVRGMGSGEWRK